MGKDNSDLPGNENIPWPEDYSNWPLQPSLGTTDDAAGDKRTRQTRSPDAASQDTTDKTGSDRAGESDLAELQSIAGHFHAAFNTVLRELDTARRHIDERTRQVTELNHTLEEISTELHTRVESAREQQETYHRETTELNARIEELDAQRSAATQEIEDLRRQLETQTRETGELGERIDKLTSERDTQSQENRELQEAYHRETDELNARIGELTNSLQQANTRCQEIEEHSARIEKLNTALHEAALSEADLYRKQIETRTREAEELASQLETLRSEHRQIVDNPPRNEADNQTIESLQHQVEAQTRETEELASQLETLRSEHKQIVDNPPRNEADNQAIESLQRQVDELNAALEESEARYQASEATRLETTDHTSRLEAVTRALTIAENALHQMDELATDAVLYIRDGKTVYANPGYLCLLGEGSGGIPELQDFIHPDDSETFARLLADGDVDPAMNEPTVFNLVLPAGSTLTVEMGATQASFGGEPCVRLTLHSQVQATDPDNHRGEPARLDLLTGLYNRQHFLEILEARIAQEHPEQEHLAVMYVLLDNFMLIRNEAGILDSEHVLKEIAELLDAHCNESGVLARFGDCTFTMLYRCDSAENVTTRAEQVRELVEAHIAEVGGQSIITTASVGVCQVNEYTHSVNDIITRADLACEVARSSGGNQVHIHSTLIDQQIDQGNEENWDKVIRETLEQQRLYLAYQPIISLGDETGQRYEVLLRIMDAENKIILPGQFISVAEKIGLSADIDRYVIDAAFKVIAENDNRDVMLFIKLSNASVADAGLPGWIREKQKEYGLGENRIIFEITENAVGKHLQNAVQLTRALHDMDCMVAIEHCTSRVQPQHLRHVHADILKIDGSLVSELDKNSEHRTRIAAIVDLARENHTKTVAERVEDAGSLALLWDLGIHYAQGNFIQEPCLQLDYDFFGEIVSAGDHQDRAIYMTGPDKS